MTASRCGVHIYDPNLNSYGFELAACLAQAGHKVTWWAMASLGRPQVDGVRQVTRLAPIRGAASWPNLLLGRLVGPIRFCISARRQVALICWVRDPWDAALFWLRASFGLPTVVVYHDPRELRPRPGMAGRIELALLRRATVVVHSAWHQGVVRDSFPDAVVAPHPPYAQSVAGAGGKPEYKPTPDVYCLVGGLRPDKGLANLVPLAQATKKAWRLRVIGPDTLSAETASALMEAGVQVEYARTIPPSDTELISLLSTSAAMIAPYAAPTTSGSVIMAVTVGVPVLALRSIAFEGLLPQSDMAADIAGLARLMDEFSNSARDNSTRFAPMQAAEVGEVWSGVVERA